MTRAQFALAAGLVAAAHTHGALAQTIAQRVDAIRDGIVLMSFTARPGVCGNGAGSISARGSWNSSGFSDQRNVCIPGPVRVSLGRADNGTVSVRVYVGGEWHANATETDLGLVRPADAVEYLLGIARVVGGRSGSDAVSAAALADYANVAPGLVTLVRDANASLETRRQALYWVEQTDLATRELARLYDDLPNFALREHFTFVISQRHDDAAVDKLIDVAQHDPDLEIRKRAMYWLGQTGDPRAVKFLRDLVTR